MSTRSKLVLISLGLLVLIYVAPSIGRIFRDTPREKFENKLDKLDTTSSYPIQTIDDLYAEARKFYDVNLEKRVIEFKVNVDTGIIKRDEWTEEVLENNSSTLQIKYKYYAGAPYKYSVSNVSAPTIHPQFRKAAKIKKETGWDNDVCTLVLQRKIKIGMTKKMVVKSWGRPEDINRTTYAFGVHEQWVYGYNYVYFEDGIVTTIQN